MSSSTPYAAQIRAIELLERGRSQTTEIKVYRDGSQLVPTSATYTITKPTGADLISGASATIAVSGTVSYTHTAEQLAATLDLGEGYVQEWTLEIDGEEYLFRRMAALVRRRLYPVWFQLLRRIRNRGMGYEYLMMTPESFFESHRHLSLYLIFRDFHSSLGQSNGRYLDLANEHYRLYRDEFDSLNFVYDEDHNGEADDPNKRTRGQPTIFLNRPGQYYRRRRY
jgi:hypothetical protein